MSEWKTIESYDQLKKKPKLAVFWFQEVPAKRPGGFSLPACANLNRIMGNRVCLYWMPLDLPNLGDGQ